MLWQSIPDALRVLDPRTLWRNPVMLIVEFGAACSTALAMMDPTWFTWLIVVWLWLTVVFANLAEGRGKAQANRCARPRQPRWRAVWSAGAWCTRTRRGRRNATAARRHRRGRSQADNSRRRRRAGGIASVIESGGIVPRQLGDIVDGISAAGGTPLVVGQVAGGPGRREASVLGVIHLKDVVEQGMRKRFDEMRRMSIRTVMITGDNPLTARAADGSLIVVDGS